MLTLTADCWACVLHALLCSHDMRRADVCRASRPSLCEQLRVSAVCRASRLAISLVREIWLKTAAECDARMLARFTSVHHVTIGCFERAATLEETMMANPGTEQHPSHPDMLQHVGTESIAPVGISTGSGGLTPARTTKSRTLKWLVGCPSRCVRCRASRVWTPISPATIWTAPPNRRMYSGSSP